MSDHPKIRVKFCTLTPDLWLRQFPQRSGIWGNCQFIFDADNQNYDWFVVYNDFPRPLTHETLGCPAKNTLLVTNEPPSIKSYGIAFTRQFGTVLTSQPEWALPHPDRVFSQPALHWFYGWGKQHLRTYEQLQNYAGDDKHNTIATVCSSKQQRHTLHNQRYTFTQALKKRLPELEIFGHGVRLMDDKAEALDPYRYHIAIENYQGEHHWTEKLSDAFLGLTLPFYFGCPNLAEYFPEKSYIPIDIFDVEGSLEKIESAIKNNEWQKRLPAIREARHKVLTDYNLFSVLSHEISRRHHESGAKGSGGGIYSRHMLRREKPLTAIHDFYEKIRVRLLSMTKS